jgi:predicted ATPase
MVTGHRLVGKISGQLGRLPSARAHAEEALARYDPVRDRTSRFVYTLDPRAMCLIWLSHVLLALGYPEQARTRAGEAIAHARDLAHPPTLAEVLDRGCTLHPFLRDRNATREWADALVALATEHGFPLWLTMGRAAQGWALADAGQSEEGLARIRRSVAEYRATGSTMLLPDLVALLADVPGPAELAATRLGLLDEALDQVARTGGRWLEAELLRLRGETLLCQGRRDGAGPQACFERAVAVAKEQGAKWWELRAARSLAGLWAERGERRRALDLLAPVYAWFTEGLDTEDLRRTKGLLDALP